MKKYLTKDFLGLFSGFLVIIIVALFIFMVLRYIAPYQDKVTPHSKATTDVSQTLSS